MVGGVFHITTMSMFSIESGLQGAAVRTFHLYGRPFILLCFMLMSQS